MLMSHMIGDSLDELHQMAQAIGVDKKHFQNKKGKPHYDVCQTMKQKAIKLGAIEINDREIVRILKEKY